MLLSAWLPGSLFRCNRAFRENGVGRLQYYPECVYALFRNCELFCCDYQLVGQQSDRSGTRTLTFSSLRKSVKIRIWDRASFGRYRCRMSVLGDRLLHRGCPIGATSFSACHGYAVELRFCLAGLCLYECGHRNRSYKGSFCFSAYYHCGLSSVALRVKLLYRGLFVYLSDSGISLCYSSGCPICYLFKKKTLLKSESYDDKNIPPHGRYANRVSECRSERPFY